MVRADCQKKSTYATGTEHVRIARIQRRQLTRPLLLGQRKWITVDGELVQLWNGFAFTGYVMIRSLEPLMSSTLVLGLMTPTGFHEDCCKFRQAATPEPHSVKFDSGKRIEHDERGRINEEGAIMKSRSRKRIRNRNKRKNRSMNGNG